MVQNFLIEYLKKIKEYEFLMEKAKQKDDILIYGLAGAQKSFITAMLALERDRSLLYVVENPQRGKEIFADLVGLLPGFSVHYFPSLEVLPFEVIAQSHETQRKRLEVLHNLISGGKNAVVTTVDALRKALVPPDILRKAIMTLKTGQRIKIEELMGHLLAIGYQRVDMVEERGQVSVRGGILDVFPPVAEEACRIEFFDDEIDSIRAFSTDNQRSIKKIYNATITPAAEFFLAGLDTDKVAERIQEEAEQLLEKMEAGGRIESHDLLKSRAAEVVENISQGQNFPGYEQFLPYFFKEKHTLVEYFSSGPLIIIDEPNRQREKAVLDEREMQETYKSLLEKGGVLPGQIDNYFTWEELQYTLSKITKIYFSLLPKKSMGMDIVDMFGVTAKTAGLFMSKTKLLADELKEWKRQKFAVVILINSPERGERLRQMLWDMSVEASLVTGEFTVQAGGVYIVPGNLSNGFEFTTWKLVVLTEHELYHQPKKKAPRRIFREEKRTTFLADLQVGDYVVHTNHGIGKYLGIEKLEVGDSERDYLVMKYKGEDKLYLPTDQAGQLQKYSYQEGQSPRLSKLGGNEWNKVKSKVKAAVKDLAEELIALYAARRAIQGYKFAADSPWQKDFEEAFPFEETPDQLRAIEEVKKDMEGQRPMDRLLCGDVGYGKTEVAIRAAFKAVTDGKQVAVLVPTTVLAQQHYNTFRERFEGFAVKVGVLSRFRSYQEQKAILKEVKLGQTDIVIGTHRLLSSDVKYKDLGLLIVDEEQRFGVSHKEKIKKMKKAVDVLTLTATPIPRTLHMSMVGVRDMSIIETPPEDRYPVQTFVVEHSPHLVREAIRREMGRGGQVYYVHNRIEDIDSTAVFIQELVPEAHIAIGHGRMTEEELERVMLDFIEGKIDILVCTTIIETGMDISNVNTLIVDNADKMGLAQLYQLRGRVGRSNRIAYAYLTYNRDKILSETAEKRLSAIREFTELGSGFKIAMRDLEIRGAGNILGAEQHGHVAAVGFDLYCRMLEEAVREVKGEEKHEEKSIIIDLQTKAYIPQEYINEAAVKVDFYQRIYALSAKEDIKSLVEEMEDRFGPVPEPLQNLLKIASIKIAAAQAKVKSIGQNAEGIVIVMEEDHGLVGKELMELARRYRRQVSFKVLAGLEIIINTRNLEAKQVLTLLEEVVMEISVIAQKEAVLI